MMIYINLCLKNRLAFEQQRVKALATYCGFKWRDETPSGALSIQWFNEYLKTKDEKLLQRILDYNEDDCRATLVVKDKLLSMQALLV